MPNFRAEDLERWAADLRRAANELRTEADRYKEPGMYAFAIREREQWAAMVEAHAAAIRECAKRIDKEIVMGWVPCMQFTAYEHIHTILTGGGET